MHAETEKAKNRTSNHDHVVLQQCLRKLGYLCDPRRRKRKIGGREGDMLRELLWFMCFTRGRGHQDGMERRLEFQHEPYGCHSLNPLFLKTKYFFKWLWALWPGARTYTRSLSLFYCMVWLVCVHLSLWQANTCPQGTTIALYSLSLRQDKSCSCSSNWVWNQLSSYTFLCPQLIDNAVEIFW